MIGCVDEKYVVSFTNKMEEPVSAQFPYLGANGWSEDFLEINIETTAEVLQDRLEIAEAGAGIDKSMEDLLASIKHYYIIVHKTLNRIFDGFLVKLLADSNNLLFFFF